ncbi:hypothetical protein SORBI_3001G200100 [Sorghum bicolor]|uniref:Uncharacterized protein n=2 Tax=Sorghum bicolor TaxID=4558 RepID=A0A1Z5S6J6_SORBI|nr:hypothetical protein SORBI_3001G200100 [Sorghum bicolor]
MEKGATDKGPPVVEPALDLPRPRHSMAARLVASVRVARVGLGAAASGVVGAASQAVGRTVLDASSGVVGAMSQDSSAKMATAAAQTSEAAAGQALQVTDGDDNQSDLLGGLDSSQNLETTNKKRNSDDCTPEASKRSRSGSNHPGARARSKA